MNFKDWQILRFEKLGSTNDKALEISANAEGCYVIRADISLYQSIKQISPQADISLKWPNDVLLNGAKISGILLEKADGNYMIVGIGVNIEKSPHNEDLLYPTTSLKEAGIQVTGDDFLMLYLRIFSNNMNILKDSGFESLRQFWNNNAKAVGDEIVVRQEKKDLQGIFRGINEKADLLLEKDEKISKITFGDVFYKE